MTLKIGLGKLLWIDLIKEPKQRKGDLFTYNNCTFGQPMPVVLKTEGTQRSDDEVTEITEDKFKDIAQEISKEVKLDPSTIEYILKLASEFGDKK